MEDDGDDIERKLQGRTLQVYLYLQKKKEPSGIRELQRDLGLSSPSVAEYQIEKLAGMGIVSRDSYGRVVLARKVKVKAMESHVSLGRFSVPRLAFYATIFSAVAVLYGIFDGGSLYGVAVPAAAAAVLWAEARKMWKFSLAASSRKEKEKESIMPLLVPAMAALAVFVAGAVFIFQYAPEPSFVQVQAPAPIQPLESRPTIEESVEMSRQKVAASAGEQGTWPDLLISMSLGGAAVIAFLAYILIRYRSSPSSSGVLVPVQQEMAACGTQDYPERLR